MTRHCSTEREGRARDLAKSFPHSWVDVHWEGEGSLWGPRADTLMKLKQVQSRKQKLLPRKHAASRANFQSTHDLQGSLG